MRRAAIVAALTALSAGALATACSAPKVPPGKEARPQPKRVVDAGPAPIDDGEPPSVPSRAVTTIANKAIGPFYARGAGNAALAAWIANDAQNARRLFTLGIGGAKQEPWSLTSVPPETTALVVRAAADRKTFFAAWSALLDRGEVLAILTVGADGDAKGQVVDVTRTNDHVVWLEIVPTARGAVCVWAEETRDGDANILSAAIEPDGRLRGLPTRVARGASGWQAIAAPNGAGVAIVTADTKKEANKHKAGTLAWVRLDGDGRPVGAPVPIATTPTVTGDVDVVASSGGFVFAWTDRSGEDPEVMLATVDEGGRVQPPHRAMEAIGGSVLAGLAAGKGGVVLAWDEAASRARVTRRVHVAKVTLGAPPASQDLGAVEVQGRGGPELVASDAGFAMLFPASVCLAAARAPATASCTAMGIAPTFVRFDAQGAPLETQPLRLGDKHEPASLAWSLACDGASCGALAATTGAPTPVALVDLAPRATPFRAPLVPPLPVSAPRVTALKTLAGGAFAEVAAARVGDGSLVATITSAPDDDDEKPDRHRKGAVVAVRELDANADAKGAAITLTTRARTSGGVSIAASGAPEDGAAVAWTARDGANSQVHVTKVNAKGKRTNEVQLTSSKGGVGDVAIAWAGGGWIVAWIDVRDGNGEVYAARIDKDLGRVSKEERITSAPGDAGDVTLLVQGDRTLVAWADPRESTRDNFSDIWIAQLKTKDATRVGDEVRVLGTAAHSRSPSLALAGDTPVVAWIEEAPMGLDASSMGTYGAMFARLDARGRPTREPAHVQLAGEGLATEVALEPTRNGVHGYFARATRAELVVDAVDLLEGSSAYTILGVDGPPSYGVPLAPISGWLLYADTAGDSGERRLRRATIVWRR